jgi:hypothetical protein
MSVQSSWAWCSKCEVVFYGPHAAHSVCPAGGHHVVGTGSYNYELTFNGLYGQPPVPPIPPIPPAGTSHNPIPARVAGCYWTTWNPLALSAVDPAYNLIWLFAASCSSTGVLTWNGPSDATFIAELQARRKTGTCVLMTVGGASATVPLTTRASSTNFVASVKAVAAKMGGLDGLDFDIENDAGINATELVWIGQQLKAAMPGFNITWAGASPNWITSGPPATEAMVQAGVLDMVGVMCYDWGQSTEAAKISVTEQYINDWAGYVGASRVCIGIELPNADDPASNTFGGSASAIAVWNWAKTAHPGVRGMDIWTAYEDARAVGGSNGTFVSQVIPAVLA